MKKLMLKYLSIYIPLLIVFLVLSFSYSPIFIVGIITAGIALSAQIALLACPSCGYSVFYQEHEFFGNKIMAFFPWFPKNCPQCGKEIK
jgi:predicted RNA-binding Zn-ribbon protein involved in translation (DUF1610 family)